MKILVINSGSSSIKYRLFDMTAKTVLASGVLEQIGEAESQLFLNLPGSLKASDYRYLSFRHYIDGEYAIPADGMIGRWILGP